MRAFLLAAALLLSLFLAGCGEENESKAGTCTDVPGDVRTVEVHVGTKSGGGGMYLTPTTVTAVQGEKLRFKVTNDDASVFHDVALKDYAGATYEHEVDGGHTVCTYHGGQPYLTASAKGTFELYCEVPGHKDAGMKGSFIVS
jgi:uncharacterized cupredoxin-like copper-binding protein